jgi:hypothetical protein
MLTTAFRDYMAQRVTETPSVPTPFNAANAHIGVGSSATAPAAGQTDLQAATDKVRRPMEPGYPSVSTNVMQFRSVFGSGVAEWAWQEWGVFNALSGGTMMNRATSSLGTKSPGTSWQLTVQITLTVA